MEKIRGFIRVSEDFFCSGQPSRDEFADLQEQGIKLVVNLAMSDSEGALHDEGSILESLGIGYVQIPVPFAAPTLQHFLQFESELLSHGEGGILVHCALNWRASSFVALFRQDSRALHAFEAQERLEP